MSLPSTREIILKLKTVKEEKKLSVPCIQRMCEVSGHYMAINTFRNIFAKGSENNSFSYEHTLKRIADVLLPESMTATEADMDLKLLTNQLINERKEHKEQIEKLNRRIKEYQSKTERQEELIKQLLEKCNVAAEK